MPATCANKDIESDAVQYMQDEQRIPFEKYTQSLKQLRSQVQAKIDQEGNPESSTYGEGIHAAIAEIVKAMKNLRGHLS